MKKKKKKTMMNHKKKIKMKNSKIKIKYIIFNKIMYNNYKLILNNCLNN